MFSSLMTVLKLFPTAWSKSSKISYLREFSAQVSQIVFLAHLTVLRFFITKWRKASKILYLNKFTAQVSQIVFWAHLTVLRLITSVWGKTSKISYLREFSAQVSQIVFWVHLTVLQLITTVFVKRSNELRTRFVILVHWTHGYEIFEVLLHTVVGSRKMVKIAENTICDTCAVNSRRYEIS